MGVENPKPNSFLELVQAETVDPADIVRVFEDYVRTGVSIHAETVIALLNTPSVQAQHLGAIGESVGIGLSDQKRRGFSKDASEFEKVGRFVSERLTQLSRENPTK